VGLLDAPATAPASEIATSAAALASSAGAERTGLIAPWVSVPGTGGPRQVPGSIIAAGLIARGDGQVGHANHAPMFDQGRGAGSVRGALAASSVFSDADTDELYDAGVNVFRDVGGVITLTGFKALGGDPVWRQLNIGRLTMEVSARVSSLMYQYLGSPIDGQGILLSQIGGDVTGYLLDLYNRNALFGATPDDALSVVCDFTNNTPETIAAGEVHVDVAITAATAAEQIRINVVTALAG
jgi:phage tail sheath protein FI